METSACSVECGRREEKVVCMCSVVLVSALVQVEGANNRSSPASQMFITEGISMHRDTQHTPRERLIEHLPRVRHIAHRAGRRRGLASDEVEDFTSRVVLHLMQDDCAALARFRYESQWQTYLTSIIERCLINHQRQHLGRWRPSRAAQRLGPTAIELERLTHRDGLTVDEAIASLTQRAPRASDDVIDADALRAVAAQLPVRAPRRRFVSDAALLNLPSHDGASNVDKSGHARFRLRAAKRLRTALIVALRALPDEDLHLLHARFVDGQTVTEIARRLGRPRRPLFHRFQRLYRQLQQRMRAEGVERGDLDGVLGANGTELVLADVLRDAMRMAARTNDAAPPA
ncbi:MAG: sigma-70 family RNA polymerase sigma factor [Acidobacteriota bacterium]